MKANELRVKSKEDLLGEILNLQQELFKLRVRSRNNVGAANDKVFQTHGFRRIRRDIARIKTILKERENLT